MVLQVRDALHRPIVVNIPVTPVSNTVGDVKGVFLAEGVHSLIFRPRSPCAKHQVTNKGRVEQLVWNLDCFHVRHVFINLPRQMHQS